MKQPKPRLLPVHDNYDSPLRPQWDKLMKALTEVEVLTLTFRDSVQDLQIIAARIAQVAETFKGYNLTPITPMEIALRGGRAS